jgi:hypothetical protein
VEVFSLSEEFHFMKSINKRGGRAQKSSKQPKKREREKEEKQPRPLSFYPWHCIVAKASRMQLIKFDAKFLISQFQL